MMGVSQSLALALPNILGTQLGLYSDFGWATSYVVVQQGMQVAFFGWVPRSGVTGTT